MLGGKFGLGSHQAIFPLCGDSFALKMHWKKTRFVLSTWELVFIEFGDQKGDYPVRILEICEMKFRQDPVLSLKNS